MLPHPKYRKDIDGLRAVAVLAVCLFHAFPKEVHGGFIGVDIFFVISGFLISTIIFQSLDRGRFSFLEFYARRIRRIFPALIMVLLAVFVAGWFILFPNEYKQLGKHITGGALFVSNFVLWHESGYFDAAAETKPLLHLWSLGIEEQFYIVFPLTIWLAWKVEFNRLTLVALIGLASFFINVSYVHKNAAWTFYYPQTRFWELMTGAVLAQLVMDMSGRIGKIGAKMDRLALKIVYAQDANPTPGETLAHITSWLGAILVAIGIWRIHKDTAFPGTWALAPTFGAAFLIWAGPQAFVNKWLLSNRVAVWFGKISYPLYLWHWPLLVYLRIVIGDQPTYLMRGGALITAIALSWLTYCFIEAPIRFGSSPKPKTLALAVVMCVVLGVGASAWQAKGNMPLSYLRMDPESAQIMVQIETAKKRGNDERWGQMCFQLPPNKDFEYFIKNGCLPSPSPQPAGGVMLIGDSHSASLSLGLKPWAEKHGLPFYQLSSGSCSLFNNDPSNPDLCQEYIRRTFEVVQSTKPAVLIVDMYWDHAGSAELRNNLIQRISSMEADKIMIVGQIPTWKGGLPDALRNKFVSKGEKIPERNLSEVNLESLEMDQVMRSLTYQKNVRYLSLKDILCNRDGCLTKIGDDITTDLVVWDYGHLTEAASRYVTEHGLGNTTMQLLKER